MPISKIKGNAIEDDAITSARLDDGTIVAVDLASDSVTTAKIAADAVDGTKIADDSIDSEHIADGAVDLVHLSATGTKDATTFLRGDNSFQVVTTPTLSSLGIDNHDDITVDANGNIGVNDTDPDSHTTSGKVVSIKGTANNSGPSVIRMEGATNGAGFLEHQVFGVASIPNTFTEISKITGTGANGFRMMFEVFATGHTGGAANGFNRYKGYWDGATNSVFMIEWQRSYDGAPSGSDFGKPPIWDFDTTTSNELSIQLKSGDSSGSFNGVVEVKYWIPIDFASSTWTTD